MVREGRWKYATYLDGTQELYDVVADPGEWHNLADDTSSGEVANDLRAKVLAFWDPEGYLGRLATTPRARREKHFYEFSNQFMLGNGTVANARP